MGSPGCAAALQNIVEAAEFGNKPFPIFFADPTCTMGQWPPPGQVLSETLIQMQHGFDLRAQACQQSPNVPAQAFTTDSFPRIPVENCPLPVIQLMFLPSFYSYKFWAINSPDSSHPSVQDPGGIILNNNNVNSNNFWVIDPSAIPATPPIAPSLRANSSGQQTFWGSTTIGTFGQADCNYVSPDSFQFSPWFDSRHNLATYNLNSCGMSFWPALTGVYLPLSTFVDSDGTICWTVDPSGDPQNDQFACGSTGGYSMSKVSEANTGLGACRRPAVPPTLFGGTGSPLRDCLSDYSTLQQIASGGSEDRGLCIAQGYDIGDDCSCQAQFQLNGSVTKLQIIPTAGSWELQQFIYCTGTQFSIAGIPVQRYGNSTIACDPIVTSLCQNTAFVASNSNYAKTCSCVLEQQRFNIQFAGLNLPVQCFASVCADNDPNVYRTVDQAVNCSERLCSQIITINGSAISAEGYQTMLCDGQEYVVQNTEVSPGPVPLITVTTPSNIELGPTFYIALGLLGVMVLLLVAWGIRKWVTSKRMQNQRRKEILQSIEGLINH